MPWFAVDDGFYDHPKVTALKMAARGLWVTAGSYCQKHLTDGLISHRQVKQLGGTSAQIQALVEHGLWEEVSDENGAIFYRFHDYLQYQRSRKVVETERERNKKRQQKHRQATATTSTNSEMSRRDTPVSNSAPSPPLPSHPKEGDAPKDQPASELTDTELSTPQQKRCPKHRHITGAIPACYDCKSRREEIEEEVKRREAEADTTEHHRRLGIRDCTTCDNIGHRQGINHNNGIIVSNKTCHHSDTDAVEAETAAHYSQAGHTRIPEEDQSA